MRAPTLNVRIPALIKVIHGSAKEALVVLPRDFTRKELRLYSVPVIIAAILANRGDTLDVFLNLIKINGIPKSLVHYACENAASTVLDVLNRHRLIKHHLTKYRHHYASIISAKLKLYTSLKVHDETLRYEINEKIQLLFETMSWLNYGLA